MINYGRNGGDDLYQITGINYGSIPISEVYYGNQKIWPDTTGYDGNEIWYKTSDNKPIAVSTFDGNKVMRNEYVPELDCCVLSFISPAIELYTSFFQNVSTLTEIVKLPNSPLLTTASYCFRNNKNLKKVNFDDFHPATLGTYFLAGCTALDEINWGSFSTARTPQDFLRETGDGTKDIVPQIGGCTAIGNYLFPSTKYVNYDLSNLTEVETIGTYFLSASTISGGVDFSGFEKCRSVGSYFMYNSLGSIDIDITPFATSVTSWGGNCLQGSRVRSITIRSTRLFTLPLTSITSPSTYLKAIYVPEDMVEQYKSRITNTTVKGLIQAYTGDLPIVQYEPNVPEGPSILSGDQMIQEFDSAFGIQPLEDDHMEVEDDVQDTLDE